MKKRTDKELEALFSTNRLEPTKQFDAKLRKKLPLAKSRTPRSIVKLAVAGLAFALVLVAGVVFLRPSQQTQIANTILLKDLFGTVQAMELPKQNEATFWDIRRSDEGGPQEKVCTQYERAIQPQQLKRTIMVFRKDAVTALYESPMYDGLQATMFYSNDRTAPAFEGSDVFGGNTNSAVASILRGSQLTDRQGVPLDPNTTTERQVTGVYDIYAVYAPDDANRKDYVAECPKLVLHIKIDASTGTYTQISAYKDSLAEENLAYRYKQTVFSSNISFEQALPVMEKAGFDLNTAKKAMGAKVSTLVNKPAGYQMEYLRTFTGEPTLQEVKNDQGDVTGYVYRFGKLPTMQAGLYTTASTQSPSNETAFRALATQKGWEITKQETMPYQYEFGCSDGDTITQLEAEDAANKLRYLYVYKTCTQFPIIYAQAPIGLTPMYYDPYLKQQIPISPFPIFVSFRPGGEPPQGL